ncbi:MAG: cell division protein FtsW [Clostridia bacterium]|nr:cell division protein FtsW [Clostridia bacterium]
MAWFDKRRHSASQSGDGIKRKRVKKNTSLLLSGRKDKSLIEEKEKALLIIQSRPDTFFAVLYVLLLALGAVLSFSAGSAYAEEAYGSGFYFVLNHLKHLISGLVVSAFIYFCSQPRFMRMLSIGFYGVSIILLIAVLFVGVKGGGAQRWLNLGFFTLQPSELAKTGIILLMSLYLTRHDKAVNSKGLNRYSFIHGFLVPSLIFLLVCVLVLLEDHFSGTIIIAAIGFGMLFLGGTYLGWFLSVIPFGIAIVAMIFSTDYARQRIISFLDKSGDSLTNNWQSTQGLYAIGTGGLFGVGLGESSLKYGYVSQPQNDFVFTIICEELGFFGAAAILMLFFTLVARGIILGSRAPDKFTSLVIYGLTFKLAIHVILNVGVVSGVLPNTGISLPFFSSGGSATISQMIDMGIILGLSRFCTQKK